MRTRAANTRAAPYRILWPNAAFNYNPDHDYAGEEITKIGEMNLTCQYCAAKRWQGEAPVLCCSGGKVHLPPISEPPEPLNRLLLGETNESKHFLKKHPLLQLFLPDDVTWSGDREQRVVNVHGTGPGLPSH